MLVLVNMYPFFIPNYPRCNDLLRYYISLRAMTSKFFAALFLVWVIGYRQVILIIFKRIGLYWSGSAINVLKSSYKIALIHVIGVHRHISNIHPKN